MPLRAIVEVRNLQSSVEFQSLETAVAYAHLKYQSDYKHPEASDIRSVFITPNRFFREDPSVIDIDVISFNKNITSESGSVAESKSIELGKNLNNSSRVANTFIRVIQFSRAFDDTSSATDNDTLFIGKNLSETPLVIEQSAIDLSKPLGNELTAIGDFTRNVLYKRVPLETIPTSDVYERQVDFSRLFFDTVYATDDLDGEASILDDQEMVFVKVRNDLAAAQEFLERVVRFNRDIVDVSNATDDTRLKVGKNEQDGLAAADNEQRSFTKPTSDAFSAEEQFSREVQYSRSPTDISSANDSENLFVGKALADTSIASEIFTRDVQFNRSFSDQFSFTDSNTTAVAKPILEALSVQEQFSRTAEYARDLQHSAAVLEGAALSVSKPATDSFYPEDRPSIGVGKTQTDPVISADAGSLVSQGYVNTNAYFAETYVGTSRSF